MRKRERGFMVEILLLWIFLIGVLPVVLSLLVSYATGSDTAAGVTLWATLFSIGWLVWRA